MRSILLLLGLTCLAPMARASTVHTVPGDFATVGGALAAAAAGDTVQVGPGTFAPSTNGESFPLLLPDGVTLLGGGMQVSVLDAEGSARVLEFNGTGSARASGFTITGGVAARGGGVHITAGTHEVDDLFIFQCGALDRGSGINVEGAAAPDVHHNIIWECYDTDLQDNGDPHGGQWGGTATGEFRQNLVGRGDSNGLFVIENAYPEVRHNIFLENGDGSRGRGMCFAGDAATVIAHNLFWANSISALVMRDSSGSFVNVDAVTANGLFTDDGVYGNLDGDPLLLDPDNFAFDLTGQSPAIDAGEPGTGTDPDGSLLDLGPAPFVDPATGTRPALAARRARLGPAAPNPFNPRTTIRLELTQAGFAKIEIHDARGRRVRSLFAAHRAAGSHTIAFDGLDDTGRSLASGVYFARLTALGEVDVQSLVLVR